LAKTIGRDADIAFHPTAPTSPQARLISWPITVSGRWLVFWRRCQKIDYPLVVDTLHTDFGE